MGRESDADGEDEPPTARSALGVRRFCTAFSHVLSSNLLERQPQKPNHPGLPELQRTGALQGRWRGGSVLV
jgi:hypothetical protein